MLTLSCQWAQLVETTMGPCVKGFYIGLGKEASSLCEKRVF